MKQLKTIGKKLGNKWMLAYALLFALVVSPAQAQFTTTSLDSVQAVVTAFLAVGAAIVLAMVIYKVGRRAANKV